jgi:hypothetical protein
LEGDVEPAVKLRLSTIEAALFTIAIGGSQYISILHWFGRPAAAVSLFKAIGGGSTRSTTTSLLELYPQLAANRHRPCSASHGRA